MFGYCAPAAADIILGAENGKIARNRRNRRKHENRSCREMIETVFTELFEKSRISDHFSYIHCP
jgi:hypothetical protein